MSLPDPSILRPTLAPGPVPPTPRSTTSSVAARAVGRYPARVLETLRTPMPVPQVSVHPAARRVVRQMWIAYWHGPFGVVVGVTGVAVGVVSGHWEIAAFKAATFTTSFSAAWWMRAGRPRPSMPSLSSWRLLPSMTPTVLARWVAERRLGRPQVVVPALIVPLPEPDVPLPPRASDPSAALTSPDLPYRRSWRPPRGARPSTALAPVDRRVTPRRVV